MSSKETEKQFFGPLTLHQKSETPSILKTEETDQSCVLCEEKFTLPSSEKQLLTHLFMKHRLVIADVNLIVDLNDYLRYWRLRFKDESISYYCTTMLMDSKPDGTESKNEEYYLLSDVLPEDKELRSHLHRQRLEQMLQHHQFEREDKNYVKECLFCRHVSNATRVSYLNHLYEKHNFHIAKPENLIFIDDLVNTLAAKLKSLKCIYCEGSFKDRTILKEHMRKKGHKRINPDNKEYDKFFLVNYLGDKNKSKSNFKQTKKENVQINSRREDNKQDSDVDSDPDWSNWTEESPLISCLICSHAETEYNSVLEHMKTAHGFSFNEITEGLNFYHKIKIVNYIRRQIHLKQCLSCETKFDDSINLEKHLKETKHWRISKESWDQPEYYFPTYEDDLFLCFISDDEESWWSSDEQEIEDRNNSSDNISKEMAMCVLNE